MNHPLETGATQKPESGRLKPALRGSPCLGEGVINRREMTAMHLGKNRLFNVFR